MGGTLDYYNDGQFRLLNGDVRDMLATLDAGSVRCCVTSPPYYGLRAYPDGGFVPVWDGSADCQHDWGEPMRAQNANSLPGPSANVPKNGAYRSVDKLSGGNICGSCGAWRGQLGHEPTPTAFVDHLVEVFRSVRRVLADDGTLWLNIGDSYAGSGKGPSNSLQRPASSLNNAQLAAGAAQTSWLKVPDGMKQKDLMMIPSRVAIALCDDGWYLRSDIAWCKRAPMPESVTDRPTSAWEHIFLLAKSERYFYDADAVRERASDPNKERYDRIGGVNGHTVRHSLGGVSSGAYESRNLRNYWELGPEPLTGGIHFAAYPSEIPRRAILAGSAEGDTVLDPFMGSGTSALVAKRLGRRSVGIELNPAYCELAVKRAGHNLEMFAL